MVRRCLAVGLVVCGSFVMQGAVSGPKPILDPGGFSDERSGRISLELG